MPYPLQQAHLLEVRAGVGQPLQGVGQVVVGAEVEAVGSQHAAHHGQQRLVLLRLDPKAKGPPNQNLLGLFSTWWK